ncbi:hypothetical protein [Pseudobacteriovorax antillogorgiicola]|nr:hypothetical protein [Pseudobacteriovorax antillogorgiicola]
MLLIRFFIAFWMLHTICYGLTSEQTPETASSGPQASETNELQASSLERIESKIEAEDQRQKEIESKEALARQQVRDTVTQADRSLAEAQLALEAYRLNLSKVTDSHLRQLQSIIAKYRSTRQELEQFSNSLNESQLSEEEAYKLYQKIRELWVEIIDDGFEIYRLAYHQEIPALVSPAPENLINQASADRRQQYQATWEQARQEYESLSQSRVDVFRLKSQEYFSLLGQISAARARSMELLGWKDLYLKEGENYLDDIVREVLAIPVKFSVLLTNG